MYSSKKFPFKAAFGNGKRVYLLSPTHHVQEDLWDRLNIPRHHRHNDYNEDVLQQIIKKAEADPSRPRQPRLIIMDDVVASLPNGAKQPDTNTRIWTSLNLSCNCLILGGPRDYRTRVRQTSHPILCGRRTAEEDSIYKQVAGDIPRELFRRMCKTVGQKYAF